MRYCCRLGSSSYDSCSDYLTQNCETHTHTHTKVKTTISNSPLKLHASAPKSTISNCSSPHQNYPCRVCHELLCTSELLQPDELDPGASRNSQSHLFEEVHRHRKHSQQQFQQLLRRSPISPPQWLSGPPVSLSLCLCVSRPSLLLPLAACCPEMMKRGDERGYWWGGRAESQS